MSSTLKVVSSRPDLRQIEQRLQSEIDEFGELQRQIDLLDPVVQRHKALKEHFERELDGQAADRPIVLRAKTYELQFGVRRNERTIVNKKKAFEAVKKALGGIAGVLAVIDIALGVIDKHVPESERQTFIREERSGYRKVEVVALQKAAPAA